VKEMKRRRVAKNMFSQKFDREQFQRKEQRQQTPEKKITAKVSGVPWSVNRVSLGTDFFGLLHGTHYFLQVVRSCEPAPDQ